MYRPLVFVLGTVLSACTFYTSCPPGGSSDNSGSGNNTSGGNGNAGGDNPSGGTGQITGEVPTGVWQIATGNLTGEATDYGDLCYVSAKPDEDRVIASISSHGLWASSDGGQAWTALGTGSGSAMIPNRGSAIIYDPDRSATFWEAGTYGAGIFRTDDNGKTFVSLGMISHNEGLSVDLSDPRRKTLLASSHEMGHVIYLSTDGGSNWDEIGSTQLPDTANVCSFPLIIDSNTFLVTCSQNGPGPTKGILRSTDGGMNWDQMNTTPAWQAPLVASDGSIYWTTEAGTGLLRSEDQGQTWTQPLSGSMLIVAPIELPDGRIAMLDARQIVVLSADAGLTWHPVTSALAFRPDGLTYSAFQRAFFVYHSSADPTIPEDSIMRYDFDFETE